MALQPAGASRAGHDNVAILRHGEWARLRGGTSDAPVDDSVRCAAFPRLRRVALSMDSDLVPGKTGGVQAPATEPHANGTAFESVALLLQGGGALGAYQAGV